MNHLNSIYQRLQSNYSDCDITYAPGLLTVKCKNGEIRADGFRTCFLEDGKTVQEFLKKNDDDLYEEMERFILYLQEGGANLETESLPTESEESAEDAEKYPIQQISLTDSLRIQQSSSNRLVNGRHSFPVL